MKKILILFISVLLFYIACSKKSEPVYAIEIVDGVERVHNSGTPMYAEKTVEFVEDLAISFKNDIGVLSFLPDGRLLVLDPGQRRISFFSADDIFLTSHNFQNSSYGLFLTSSSSYVKEETQLEAGAREYEFRRRLFVRAYDLSGNERISYGEFTAKQSGFINDPDGSFSYTLPFFVYSIFAGDKKNEKLYHCLNNKYVIDVYDMKSYVDGFRNSSEKHKALVEKFTKMPRVKTVTEKMIVDDLGNLWIERPPDLFGPFFMGIKSES